MKMEPIVNSETSAIRTQTPGNYPKRNNLHIMNNLSEFEPVNERICKIRVTVKCYNLTLISTHAPTEE